MRFQHFFEVFGEVFGDGVQGCNVQRRAIHGHILYKATPKLAGQDTLAACQNLKDERVELSPPCHCGLWHRGRGSHILCLAKVTFDLEGRCDVFGHILGGKAVGIIGVKLCGPLAERSVPKSDQCGEVDPVVRALCLCKDPCGGVNLGAGLKGGVPPAFASDQIKLCL